MKQIIQDLKEIKAMVHDCMQEENIKIIFKKIDSATTKIIEIDKKQAVYMEKIDSLIKLSENLTESNEELAKAVSELKGGTKWQHILLGGAAVSFLILIIRSFLSN